MVDARALPLDVARRQLESEAREHTRLVAHHRRRAKECWNAVNALTWVDGEPVNTQGEAGDEHGPDDEHHPGPQPS